MAFDGTLKFDTAIDQSGFQSGLSGLGSLAKRGFGAVINSVTTVGKGLVELGAKAIEVGSGFEKSMEQVIATMGITKDTVQDGVNSYDLLKEAAAAAGETTTFSASEAADALNYLALAGYSAQQAADALPAVLDLAAALGDVLGKAAAKVSDYLPKIIQLGISVIQNLVKGLQKNSVSIGKSMSTVAVQLSEAIFDILPEIFSLGTELFLILVKGIAKALPDIAEAALTGIEQFTDSLVEYLPMLIGVAVRIVQTLSDTLTDPEGLERLLAVGEAIISALLSALSENLPALVQAGADILVFLCETLLDPENIGMLLTAAKVGLLECCYF